MPLDQFWAGQSPQFTGATTFTVDMPLQIKEGYFTGATFEYVNVGTAYIDNIRYQSTAGREQLTVSASSELKKFRSTTLQSTEGYESVNVFNDQFDKRYQLRWQATGSNWSQGVSEIVGVTASGENLIFYTQKSPVEDFVADIKLRVNTNNNSIGFGFKSTELPLAAGLTQMVYIIARPGTSSISLQKRDGGGALDVFTVGFAFTPSLPLWLRLAKIGSRYYGFYSEDGQAYNLLGGSFYTNEQFQTGTLFVFNSNNITRADDFNYYSLQPYYDINRLTEGIAFKAGIRNVHIPYLFSKDFTSDYAGFTYLGVAPSINGDGTLTIVGASHRNVWNTVFSNPSFLDFRFDVEVYYGPSAFGGIMFGASGNNFTGFYFMGASTNMGLSELISSRATQENLIPWSGNSVVRSVVRFPALVGYPYINDWHKFSLIKQGGYVYCEVDDILVHGYYGVTSFNPAKEVVLGMMTLATSTSATPPVVKYRNFRVHALNQQVPQFQINANSSLENAMSRLQESGQFSYKMSGATMTVNLLAPTDTPVRSFNVGNSGQGWDQYDEDSDNIINHVVVNGAGVQADVWDYDLLAKQRGKERLRVITDETIVTTLDARQTAKRILDETKRSLETPSFQAKANLDIEKDDVIGLRDEHIGLTAAYRVENTNKNFSPQSGSFTQTFTLEKL